MRPNHRARRFVVLLIVAIISFSVAAFKTSGPPPLFIFRDKPTAIAPSADDIDTVELASEAIQRLAVKGRAPKTNYSRTQFSDGWANIDGCDERNNILRRDLKEIVIDSKTCHILSGILLDPYTGKKIKFVRGPSTSADVQIDHVVALSNAWQTGAQQLSYQQRHELANDPLELLAVDGSANQQKSDGDAATWLPPYKPYRCQYVARQIAVKQKYSLWLTLAEKQAILQVLNTCPTQKLPV